MSYTARFDKIPPNLCRFLARTHRGLRLMTEDEICKRSGLSRDRVVQVSHMRSWGPLPLSVIEAFSQACGVNLLAPKKHVRFLKRTKMGYIDRATPGQRGMLKRLLTDLDVTNRTLHYVRR